MGKETRKILLYCRNYIGACCNDAGSRLLLWIISEAEVFEFLFRVNYLMLADYSLHVFYLKRCQIDSYFLL